jgi:hypothetical protein
VGCGDAPGAVVNWGDQWRYVFLVYGTVAAVYAAFVAALVLLAVAAWYVAEAALARTRSRRARSWGRDVTVLRRRRR